MNFMKSSGMEKMMLLSQITPAQLQPIPSITAKLQLAWTAIKVATSWATKKASTSNKPGRST